MYELISIIVVIMGAGFLGLHFLQGMGIQDSILSLVSISAYVLGPMLAYTITKEGLYFLKIPTFIFLGLLFLGCIGVLYIYACILTLKLVAIPTFIFFGIALFEKFRLFK